jgi:hypothetical protein
MCRFLAVALALGVACCAGCLGRRGQSSTSRAPAGLPFSGPTGADVVQIDVALLEAPVGNAYLNHGLWQSADEQLVPLERKNVLRDNGFRVGAVGGLPPAELLALLTSPRSCPDPRRIRTRAENPLLIPVSPPRPTCAFRTRNGSQSKEVSLSEARCFLEVVPSLVREGQVRLRFTPLIKHGKPTRAPRPRKEPSGTLRWQWSESQPQEVYDWLAWELTVSPGEYVVIGTTAPEETLGRQCFFPAEGERPVQKLLVLRATHLPGAAPLDKKLSRVPPLAIQATWSARGTSP